MTHKKLIALDFDGVLHSYTTPWTKAETISDGPTAGAMEFLRDLTNDERFEVAVHSSRCSSQDGIDAISAWLQRNLEERFGYFDGGAIWSGIRVVDKKPSAWVGLDDRILTFVGTWPSLDRLAAFLPWQKRPAHLLPDPETAMAVADSLLMQIGQIAKDAGCPDDGQPLDFIRSQLAHLTALRAQDKPLLEHVADKLVDAYPVSWARVLANRENPDLLQWFVDKITESDEGGFGDPVLIATYLRGKRTAALMVREAVGDPIPGAARRPLSDDANSAILATIRDNPGHWQQAIAKPSLAGWFVGQVMRAVEGEADPDLVRAAIEKRLEIARSAKDAPAEEPSVSYLACEAINYLLSDDAVFDDAVHVDMDGVRTWHVPWRGRLVYMPELAFAGCKTNHDARKVAETYLDAFGHGQALGEGR